MSAAERAVPDALATLTAYGLAALWLLALTPSGLVAQLAGLCAGAVLAFAGLVRGGRRRTSDDGARLRARRRRP